jgi:DNA-directed RNA polymerase specialized sigma24 family protein
MLSDSLPTPLAATNRIRPDSTNNPCVHMVQLVMPKSDRDAGPSPMTSTEFFALLPADFLDRLQARLEWTYKPDGDLAYDAALAAILDMSRTYDPGRGPAARYALWVARRAAAKAFVDEYRPGHRRRSLSTVSLGRLKGPRRSHPADVKPPTDEEPHCLAVTDSPIDSLDDLPHKLYVTCALVHVQGYSLAEAAALLGVAKATVHERLTKAAAFISQEANNEHALCLS